MQLYFKRGLGYCFDLFTAFIVYFLFFAILGFLFKILGVTNGIIPALKEHFNQLSNFKDQLYTNLAFLIYLLCQDIFIKNNAISRKIFKIKLVDKKNGEYPQFKSLILRNLIKSIVIVDLLYLLFTGKLLHDVLSNTTLINKNQPLVQKAVRLNDES